MKPILALFAAGMLLCLSACGQDVDPPAQADPTPSISPTKTGPAQPVMPDVATRQTKAGAIAFARYYWHLVDYAQRSLDTSGLRQLTADSCVACAGGADWIDSIKRRGGTISGGTHTIARVWTPGHPTRTSVGLVVAVRVSEQTVTSAGSLNHRYRAGTDQIPMALNFVAGGWEIASWHVS